MSASPQSQVEILEVSSNMRQAGSYLIDLAQAIDAGHILLSNAEQLSWNISRAVEMQSATLRRISLLKLADDGLIAEAITAMSVD